MTIVMGLDQHRAQITAEWLDAETGEITRSRITRAHRQGVRLYVYGGSESFGDTKSSRAGEVTIEFVVHPPSDEHLAGGCGGGAACEDDRASTARSGVVLVGR